MPLNVLFRLQICIDTIERNIREAILLSIIAHGETEAYEGRIVGESGFERLGLQVLLCIYFYRIDVSAKLDDEIQFQLTVFFAIVVDGDIAQCMHLAANEVLCEISLVGIFVVGQEQERSWSFIHRPNNPQSSMNNLKAPISSCTFRGIPKVLMRFTL